TRSHLPQPGTGTPGRGRRGDVRRLPGARRTGVPRRPRARHCDGDLRRHDRRRGGGRPARRWGAHRRARMGVDLLPQRPDRRGGEPMLPLALFKRPAFTGVQLAAFAISASVFALFLYITLYLQNYLGYSPLEAGLRYLPLTVVSFFLAPIAGALLSRVPAR